MRRKRSKLSCLGVLGSATSLSLAAAACGSASASVSSTPATNNKTIGLSIADQTSLFYIAEADGVKAEAKKAGYKVILESANDSGSLQVAQVHTLIADHVRAMIFTPTNAAAATSGVVAANDAHIPVVGVDERPPPKARKTAKEVTYIASNSVHAAKQECTWMAKKIGAKGNIAIIEGVLGVTAQVERSQGCEEALSNYPHIHVVAKQAANWMEDKAYSAAQTILAGHKNLKAIFAESDAMALGTARAVQSTHYSPYPVIISMDGFPTEFQALRAKKVSATEAQQPYHMGVLAVQDAIKALHGKSSSIPPVQYQPTFFVTQRTVSQWPPHPPLGSTKDLYGPLGL